MTKKLKPQLKQDKPNSNDYTLDINQGSIWITIGNKVLHICPIANESGFVTVYYNGKEMSNPITSMEW